MPEATPHPNYSALCFLPDGSLSTKGAAREQGYHVADAPVTPRVRVRRLSHAETLRAAGIPPRPAPATAAAPSLTAEQENGLILKGVTRAFRSALMQLPEAACRPAAAAKLADMETFTADQVAGEGFTIGPQLDRAQSFLRGLPPEMLPDDEQAERSATYDAGMRRRVEVAMATLPSTGPSNRIRSKLGRVLMSANEGRPIRAALASYGFDPEAYAPRNHPEN